MTLKLVKSLAGILLALSLCLVSSCTPSYQTSHGFAMNASVSVTCRDRAYGPELLVMANTVENRISAHIATSDVARLNQGEAVMLSSDLKELLLLCEEIRVQTNGAFSILTLPITSLWRFDDPSFTPPSPEELAAACQRVHTGALSFDGNEATVLGGGMDLGAVGKGYACDILAQSLRERAQTGVIAVGGSIAAVGFKNKREAWRIGVRNPFSSDPSDTVGFLSLSDAFVSTSGSYEKKATHQGVTYHHIINPQTGYPIQTDLVGVTVVAPTGALSDILSTACFAVGIERGRALCALYGAQALFITADGTVTLTEGMADLFTHTGKGQVILP